VIAAVSITSVLYLFLPDFFQQIYIFENRSRDSPLPHAGPLVAGSTKENVSLVPPHRFISHFANFLVCAPTSCSAPDLSILDATRSLSPFSPSQALQESLAYTQSPAGLVYPISSTPRLGLESPLPYGRLCS